MGLDYFLGLMTRTLVVAAVASAAIGLLRLKSAAARHAVWTVVMAGMLVVSLVAISAIPFSAYMADMRLMVAFGRTRALLWATPLAAAGRPQNPVPPCIGLIPGSENAPEKRWPASHWVRLIASLPGHRFILFGTAGDQPIAAAIASAAIAAGIPPGAIENLAGRTDLPALAARLGECRPVVSNDSGGMHLANAVGAPVIGLFGPTNPVRTAPVFSAPSLILQPPGCPPTGGAALAGLSPEPVTASVLQFAGEGPAVP